MRIVKDQIKERGAVIVVSNRESAIQRKASVKTVLRQTQLKYVDVEETRVITNNRCKAEQIKNDKAENVVMDGSKVGEFGKVGREQNLKSSQVENWNSSTRRCRAKVRRDCASQSLKGLARRNREKHAMLADVEEEEEQDVICFDDITGKELRWHAVRKARELELKHLRDLGVYEKIDENEAAAKYGITPVDTKWVDTVKAFEGEPMQIRSRIVAREFKSEDRPDLYAGTPPLEALKAIISIAANQKETFSIMHIDLSHAYFHAKTQRPMLIRLLMEDRMGADAGKTGLMKKSMYGTR